MRTTKTLGFAFVFLLIAFQAFAADRTTVQKELVERYSKRATALKHKAIRSYMEFYSADYRGELPDGRVFDREQQERNLRENLASAISVSRVNSTIEKLVIEKSFAITTVHHRASFVFIDRNGKFGRMGDQHTVSSDSRSRDTWKKVGSKWKIAISEQLTGSRMYLDDK
jgi:hypothetical protein